MAGAGTAVILDGYYATYADEPTTPVSLTLVKDSRRGVVLHGQVVLIQAGQQPTIQPGLVQTPPISDWIIEYSQQPSLWICAQNKWYKLLRPSPQYVQTHTAVQRKFDLAARTVNIMRQRQDLKLDQVHQLILSPTPGLSTSATTYTVQDLQAEAAFVFGQLAALCKKMKWLQGDNFPLLLQGIAAFLPPEEVSDILLQLNDDGGAQAKRARLSVDPQVRAKDLEADLARGPPPAACVDWRVEPHLVTDLLLVWEMTMTFAHLLQLPPITLDAFQAAIMPGPVPVRTTPHPPVPAPPGGRDADEQELPAAGPSLENDYLGFGSMRRAVHVAKTEGSQGQEDVVYNLNTLLDADGASSGLILRDMHVALIKVIDGFSIKRLQDPPEVSKLQADDNKTELWQEKIWQAVLDSKAPRDLIQPGAKEAVELLKTHEYYVLSASQRLAVLRTLMDLALASDVMREYIEKKVELVGAPKTKGQLNILPADPDEDNDLEYLRSGQPPTYSAAELIEPTTWIKWLDGCRFRNAKTDQGTGAQKKQLLGIRRPLGMDIRGRRYWAFGNQGGCWRIFVESMHGGGWGWYEGAPLATLVAWLRSGGIEREISLLRALEAMPIPKKSTQDPLPPYPLLLPAPAAGAAPPTIPWTAYDLKVRRPDGYRMLPAPLLKGEYHQHVPTPGRVVKVEDRTYNCCEALLTEYLDFFEDPDAILPTMIDVLTKAKQTGGPAGQAEAVTQLEALMHEKGHTSAAWNQQLRDVWIKSLARPGLSFKDVALHLSALQYHLKDMPHRMTRLTFIRNMQAAKCPLLPPQEGEHVVMMRTGCLTHLDKYSGLTKYYHVEDVAKAQAQVQQLRAVEHVRVKAIGYRSYAQTSKDTRLIAVNANQPKQETKVEIKQELLHPGLMGNQGQGGMSAAVTAQRQQVMQQAGYGANGEAAQNPSSMQQKANVTYINPNRPPCMWMALQLVQADGEPPAGQPAKYIVVPLHIDSGLSDYMVQPEVYEKGMLKRWHVNDRFRMFFGGKAGTKSGGNWYRGIVKGFVQGQGQPGDAHYDPWESVLVKWDMGAADGGSDSEMKVNPWEIEIDPDEAKRRKEEERKQREAAARAERAAKGRRGADRLKEILAEELGSEAEELEESESESESDITEDDEDDELPDGRSAKRKYQRKKPTPRNTYSAGRDQPQAAQPQQNAQLQQVLGAFSQLQQQQYGLMQQYQRLQQVGQHTSAVGVQVMTALQGLQRQQQQLLSQYPTLVQHLQAAQAQAGRGSGGQQQQGQHPHQQQVLQQQARQQQGQQPAQQQQQQQYQQQQMMMQQQQQQQRQQQGQQQGQAGQQQMVVHNGQTMTVAQYQALQQRQQQMLQQQQMQQRGQYQNPY